MNRLAGADPPRDKPNPTQQRKCPSTNFESLAQPEPGTTLCSANQPGQGSLRAKRAAPGSTRGTEYTLTLAPAATHAVCDGDGIDLGGNRVWLLRKMPWTVSSVPLDGNVIEEVVDEVAPIASTCQAPTTRSP